MVMNSHQYAFDARLEHRAAGSAALTATTTIGTVNQKAETRTPAITTIRLETCKVSAGDESYIFLWEVSNDAFSNTECAAILELGHSSVRTGSTGSSAAGDEYQVPFVTEVNGVSYKSWRIRMVAAGTSPSISFSCNTAK